MNVCVFFCVFVCLSIYNSRIRSSSLKRFFYSIAKHNQSSGVFMDACVHACMYVCMKPKFQRSNVITEHAGESICARHYVRACVCTHVYRFVCYAFEHLCILCKL